MGKKKAEVKFGCYCEHPANRHDYYGCTVPCCMCGRSYSQVMDAVRHVVPVPPRRKPAKKKEAGK